MTKSPSVLAIISAAFAAVPCVAQPSSAFPPSPSFHLSSVPPAGVWAVDDDGNHCVLVAWNVQSAKSLAFALVQPVTGNDYALTIMDKTEGAAAEQSLRRTVKIKPSAGEPSELVGLSRHDDWSLFEFTSIKLNRQQIEDLLSSAIVEVTIGDQPTALVKLDGSGALPKLHECWRMQVTRYGLDPKLAETVSRWPEPNAPTISLFTPDDYPPDAMDNNDQGSVEIRIDVDATGTKLDCKVVKSSGHASLDAKTCTVAMERGTFRPALDRTGKPIAAPYVTAVNWRLTAR